MHVQSVLQWIIPLLFSSATLHSAQNVLNPETEAFIKYISDDWNSPGGIAVAVVRRDAEGSWKVETKGYGPAAFDGRKMTENTRFGIASNSKLFAVLATGLLINNETLSPRLQWSSKIAPLVSDWQLLDPVATDELTIIDAMSHRSGLPRHDMSYRLSDNTSDIINKMQYHRPSVEFRDVYQYSNTMYVLLSTLPSRLLPSKTSFTEYVKTHILDPLGMSGTSFDKKGDDVAEGMLREIVNASDPFGDGPIRALPFNHDWLGEAKAGAGGIVTNAVDMATWLRTLLSNGAHPDTGKMVIPASVVEKAATGVTVDRGKASFPELSPIVYGGGQQRSTYRGHELIEHSGGITGHASRIARFPDLGLGVMVYSNDNTFGAHLTNIIKFRLVDEVLGLEPIDWNTRYKEIFKKTLSSQPISSSPMRPDNATIEPETLVALAGTYHNSGYGSIELCLVSPPPSPSSASARCKSLAATASEILPGAINSDVPTFLAEWDSPWATHVRLEHWSGNTFNVSIVSSVPTGNPEEPFWTLYGLAGEPVEPALAEFDFDGDSRGVGLIGVWGAGTDVPSPEGETIRERAEVWFARN
ncbi:hypothetical protein H0H92_011930 [Tricholoma furcatifolium]|nr:hypothetical protein H0H92_011930 [Tricholoma furcatifolium]